jgi:hypothetical protein
MKHNGLEMRRVRHFSFHFFANVCCAAAGHLVPALLPPTQFSQIISKAILPIFASTLFAKFCPHDHALERRVILILLSTKLLQSISAELSIEPYKY